MWAGNVRNRQPINPNQPMVGTCLACGNVLHCLYFQCAPSRDPMDDMPRAECPVCKERSLGKQGTAVQMARVMA